MDLLSAAPPFLRIPVPHVVIRKTRVIDIRYNDISRCLRSFFSLLLWRGTATVEAIERKKEGQKKSNRVSHSPNFLVVVTPSKRQMSRWTARNPPPHLGGQSSSPPPMVVSIDVTPRPRQPATSYTAVRRTGGVATALDVGAGGGNRTTAILATIHHGNSERSAEPPIIRNSGTSASTSSASRPAQSATGRASGAAPILVAAASASAPAAGDDVVSQGRDEGDIISTCFGHVWSALGFCADDVCRGREQPTASTSHGSVAGLLQRFFASRNDLRTGTGQRAEEAVLVSSLTTSEAADLLNRMSTVLFRAVHMAASLDTAVQSGPSDVEESPPQRKEEAETATPTARSSFCDDVDSPSQGHRREGEETAPLSLRTGSHPFWREVAQLTRAASGPPAKSPPRRHSNAAAEMGESSTSNRRHARTGGFAAASFIDLNLRRTRREEEGVHQGVSRHEWTRPTALVGGSRDGGHEVGVGQQRLTLGELALLLYCLADMSYSRFDQLATAVDPWCEDEDEEDDRASQRRKVEREEGLGVTTVSEAICEVILALCWVTTRYAMPHVAVAVRFQLGRRGGGQGASLEDIASDMPRHGDVTSSPRRQAGGPNVFAAPRLSDGNQLFDAWPDATVASLESASPSPAAVATLAGYVTRWSRDGTIRTPSDLWPPPMRRSSAISPSPREGNGHDRNRHRQKSEEESVSSRRHGRDGSEGGELTDDRRRLGTSSSPTAPCTSVVMPYPFRFFYESNVQSAAAHLNSTEVRRRENVVGVDRDTDAEFVATSASRLHAGIDDHMAAKQRLLLSAASDLRQSLQRKAALLGRLGTHSPFDMWLAGSGQRARLAAAARKGDGHEPSGRGRSPYDAVMDSIEQLFTELPLTSQTQPQLVGKTGGSNCDRLSMSYYALKMLADTAAARLVQVPAAGLRPRADPVARFRHPTVSPYEGGGNALKATMGDGASKRGGPRASEERLRIPADGPHDVTTARRGRDAHPVADVESEDDASTSLQPAPEVVVKELAALATDLNHMLQRLTSAHTGRPPPRGHRERGGTQRNGEAEADPSAGLPEPITSPLAFSEAYASVAAKAVERWANHRRMGMLEDDIVRCRENASALSEAERTALSFRFQLAARFRRRLISQRDDDASVAGRPSVVEEGVAHYGGTAAAGHLRSQSGTASSVAAAAVGASTGASSRRRFRCRGAPMPHLLRPFLSALMAPSPFQDREGGEGEEASEREEEGADEQTEEEDAEGGRGAAGDRHQILRLRVPDLAVTLFPWLRPSSEEGVIAEESAAQNGCIGPVPVDASTSCAVELVEAAEDDGDPSTLAGRRPSVDGGDLSAPDWLPLGTRMLTALASDRKLRRTLAALQQETSSDVLVASGQPQPRRHPQNAGSSSSAPSARGWKQGSAKSNATAARPVGSHDGRGVVAADDPFLI